MTDDMNNAALASINQRLIAHDPANTLPAVTLQDGSKVQTGTIGALLQNIKLYDRLIKGETVEGVTKEQLEEMLVLPIPTLVKVGFLDVFPADDWITGNSPGRVYVGKKAKEMGH